jgi:L-alanine-DL-glutamate epimerase-like enolase superfamily enzyme
MRLTLWRVDEQLRQSVAASRQRHDVRTRLLLEVEHEGVRGYGEVDPQPFALHGDPSVSDVVQELDGTVLLQVRGAFEREGDVPSWTRLARFAGSRDASGPAVTLVEMALLDRALRLEGRTLLDQWPNRFDTPLQVTTSLLDDVLAPLVDTGGARVRVKTAPGALGAREIAFLESLERPVILDFNCSADSDGDVLDQLASIPRSVNVVALEQPFAAGNVIDHARLAEQTSVPISLDEGVRTTRDLEQIVRYRAAQLVCVKPARVGGYANARTMIERAKELGLRVYVGGFFESELARSVNRALARHTTDEPSDIGVVAVAGPGSDPDFAVAPTGFGLVPTKGLLARGVRITSLD